MFIAIFAIITTTCLEYLRTRRNSLRFSERISLLALNDWKVGLTIQFKIRLRTHSHVNIETRETRSNVKDERSANLYEK